ncbi:hypothetical protein AAZV13_08G100600 [Glycine max]
MLSLSLCMCYVGYVCVMWVSSSPLTKHIAFPSCLATMAMHAHPAWVWLMARPTCSAWVSLFLLVKHTCMCSHFHVLRSHYFSQSFTIKASILKVKIRQIKLQRI